MAVRAPDKQEIVDALDGAARRFILMLRSIEDGSPVAVGHWTIGDVGAHVTWMSEEVYPGVAAGRGTSVTEARGLDGIEEESGRYLLDHPERRPPPLAAQIERGIQEVVEGLDSLDGDPELTWHAGLRLPATSIAAILLGELLVHGWDIGRAAGRTWSIERGDALLVSAGLLPLLPHYVDPESSAEVRVAYEVNLRGLRFALLFDRGTLTVAPSGATRPDCRIAADPVAFMLVSYGRISPVKPALTGKLLAYGRKPWLGLRLTSLLKNP